MTFFLGGGGAEMMQIGKPGNMRLIHCLGQGDLCSLSILVDSEIDHHKKYKKKYKIYRG